MPAIAGGDQDCVDVFAVEQFSKVRVELAVLVVVKTIDELFSSLPPGGLDIGDRHTSHVVKRQHGFNVVSATRSDADDSKLDLRVGAWGLLLGSCQGIGGHWPEVSGSRGR